MFYSQNIIVSLRKSFYTIRYTCRISHVITKAWTFEHLNLEFDKTFLYINAVLAYTLFI